MRWFVLSAELPTGYSAPAFLASGIYSSASVLHRVAEALVCNSLVAGFCGRESCSP